MTKRRDAGNLIVAITASMLAACSGGSDPIGGFARNGRCTMKRVRATDAERTALESATRAKLGSIVAGVKLTDAGDRVFSLRLSDAPAPASPPETEDEAVAAARVVLERYRGVFGTIGDQLPPPRLHATRLPGGLPVWKVGGPLPSGKSQDRVSVDLNASGAPTFIVVKTWPVEPSLDALCPDPRVALGDPRIRRAVTGAKVSDRPPMQPARAVVFSAADIGDIRWSVVELEPDIFRRVVDVDLQERRWTAHVDADTARLIRVDPNFVY